MSTEAAPKEERSDYVDPSHISRAEIAGMVCGILLLISLWLPWYETGSNPNSAITSAGIGPNDSANAWQTFGILPYWLVLLAAAPFILTWIVVRRHKLGWRPGEVTMISGMAGVVLILCNGIILGKPDPGIDVHLSWGWFLALIACIGIVVAGFLRQASHATGQRKPPGVL